MLKWILTIFFVFVAGKAIACSCNLPPVSEAEKKEYFARLIHDADFVVHARIKKVESLGKATIETIERFKGPRQMSSIVFRQGASASCGVSLRAGQEAVYFSFGSQVSLCGVFAPDRSTIAALRYSKEHAPK
jgi:hypothetical protein